MAAKSRPLSIRLPERTYAFVADEAARTGRSKGAVVERLAEEGLRTRVFPGIAFRGEDHDRRAWLIGTGLDVWEIVRGVEDFGSAEQLAEKTRLEPPQIRLALSYRDHFRDEVEASLSRSRRSLEQLRVRYPTFEVAGSG